MFEVPLLGSVYFLDATKDYFTQVTLLTHDLACLDLKSLSSEHFDSDSHALIAQ